MLGRSHAITGLAIGSLAAVTIPNLATTPTGWITTCIATGGAALLPDLDHSGTTVSKSLGPITQTASTLTNKLFGGHRNGTHSIIGWLIFTTLATLAAIPTITLPLPTNTPDWLPKHVSPGAITIYAWLGLNLATVFSVKGLGKPTAIVTSAALAWVTNINATWLALAVFIGMSTHCILGDMLTVEGVPLLWPLIRKPQRILILGRTGSAREQLYVWIAAAAVIAIPAILMWAGIQPRFL